MLLLLDYDCLVLSGFKCPRFVAKEIDLEIKKKITRADSQCVLIWVKSNKPISFFVQSCVDQSDQNKTSFSSISAETIILQTYLL